VCQALGRRFVLVDHNPVAIEVMRERLGHAGAPANADRPEPLFPGTMDQRHELHGL
jgi:hypothetical protein